jgi:hypothetical protein
LLVFVQDERTHQHDRNDWAEKNMLRAKKFAGIALLAILAFSGSIGSGIQKKEQIPAGTPVLWQEPNDISARDLYLGSGGEAMKPDLSKVTFVEQKTGGYSTKYEVRDGSGRRWIAKLGKEAKSDTAANRLLWAVGYVTEIAYLVPRVEIQGKGTFENVRFEARPDDVKRVGNWSWKNNPFVGTNQFQGLKVMMLLINNWDIKDENNQILASRNDSDLKYIISDLGGSLGKTGGVISRSRNKSEDFVKAKFVESVKNGRVDFKYGGKNKALFGDITVEQVKWIATRLSTLSDQQIGDAFRAANYSPEEITAYSQALKARIAQLMTPGQE